MTFLVIDIGSSSVRSLLFADDASLIDDSICSRRHDFLTDSDGRAVADAVQIQRLVESCIDEILQRPAAGSIRAVGMATFAGNWLGLDAQGAAGTAVMTYADTRSRRVIPTLLEKLDNHPDAYHQATGCMLHPAYLPAQYAYLQRTRPQALERIQRIADIGGWLYRQWFGRDVPMSYSAASWLGLLDTCRRQWHHGYLRRFGCSSLSAKLPPLADYDELQCGLAGCYAKRWKALRDAPFFLALGDGAAANVGSGAVDRRHIALTIGTTSALRAVREVETMPDGLWRYLLCADMPLVGGATSEGGNVYQWALEELGLDDDGLEAQLRRRAPDGHGLTALPLLAGERSPGWHPDASGTIHGIRRHTSRLDILQAQLEAVAIRLSLVFEMLKDEAAVVMAAGGALQASAAWAQMIANAFNAPIHLLAETEITARGVALMLRHRLDGAALDATPAKVRRAVQPNPKHVRLFQAARARQVELYQRLYRA